ncbi:MAG TPA: hemerythrin domain-containing protein [Myxococcota bacterium]
MDPAEVREQVLRNHAALRAAVYEVEALARSVLEGSRGLFRELSDLGESLLESLESHIAWEDDHLIPVLRGGPRWGEEREALLRQDHREQRQVLRYLLERLRDRERPAHLLAHNLLDFSAMLRDDMRDEEQVMLEAEVPQRDARNIDLEAS